MKFSSLLLTPLLGLSAMGCGLFGGVHVRPVGSSVQKPSNVAVFVAVDDQNQPVDGLEAKNFQIYEDGVLVDAEHSKLTLLGREDVSVHHTVVLVDLSGNPNDASKARIAKGVSHLVEKVLPTQGVTVLGFDGSDSLHSLGEFSRGNQPAPELKSIETFSSKDASRNLNGAVMKGLDQLDAHLMRLKKPVRVGTLVVFMRGDDLAGRVSGDALHEAIDKTPHEIFAIGLEQPQSYELARIGKNGVRKAAQLMDVPVAFEDMGITLNKAWSKYYLLQYCSPSRGGVRRVRIEVAHDGAEGKVEKGSVDLEFDATGFSGGCDPNVRPAFAKSLVEPGTLGNPPEAAAKAKKPSGGSSSSSGGGTSDGSSGSSTTNTSGDDGSVVAPPSSGGYE